MNPFRTNEEADAYARLGALMNRLHAFRLRTGLRTHRLEVSGSFEHEGRTVQVEDAITCRSRADDGKRMWFFLASTDEALAEADHITDAAVVIVATLRRMVEEPAS